MWKRREDPQLADYERRAAELGTWYTYHGDVWRPGKKSWREYFRWFFFG